MRKITLCSFLILSLFFIPFTVKGYNEELPASGIDPAVPQFVAPSSSRVVMRGSGTIEVNVSIACGDPCQRFWPDADCPILQCPSRPQRVTLHELDIYIDGVKVDDLVFVSPSWTGNVFELTYGGNGTEDLGDGDHELLAVVRQDIDWYTDMRGKPFGEWKVVENYTSAESVTITVDSGYYVRLEHLRYEIVFWSSVGLVVVLGTLGLVYLVNGIRESYYRLGCERVASDRELREFFKCDERLLNEKERSER